MPKNVPRREAYGMYTLCDISIYGKQVNLTALDGRMFVKAMEGRECGAKY